MVASKHEKSSSFLVATDKAQVSSSRGQSACARSRALPWAAAGALGALGSAAGPREAGTPRRAAGTRSSLSSGCAPWLRAVERRQASGLAAGVAAAVP